MEGINMKCKELMIGDWVTIPHAFPMQIVEIDEVSAYATWEGNNEVPWIFGDKDDQPQPIPLTPEILEKNGFVFRGDNYTTYGEYYLHNQSTFAIKMFNGYLVGMCMGEDLEFHYVHELQHALRLCGLDELADNFKV